MSAGHSYHRSGGRWAEEDDDEAGGRGRRRGTTTSSNELSGHCVCIATEVSAEESPRSGGTHLEQRNEGLGALRCANAELAASLRSWSRRAGTVRPCNTQRSGVRQTVFAQWLSCVRRWPMPLSAAPSCSGSNGGTTKDEEHLEGAYDSSSRAAGSVAFSKLESGAHIAALCVELGGDAAKLGRVQVEVLALPVGEGHRAEQEGRAHHPTGFPTGNADHAAYMYRQS